MWISTDPCPGRGSIQAPSEYKLEASLFEPTCTYMVQDSQNQHYDPPEKDACVS
jgi:hypothetical protein